ncbi:zinc ribbon domain-containing protein [uncultured Methanoregula sp.]|uniref:zinc ribbon domain-containing protein n=1 Tax=uncultured Methanoregula sp. TaxID=1005933 RepID=UPI002AAC0B16|nr:zinc ribbon domain-containing protein [uncultured Methanoregula sp.]
MGNKFCTACGAALSEGVKFCEHCGNPADQDDLYPEPPVLLPAESPEALPQPDPGVSKKIPVSVIGGIVVVLVIFAVLAVIFLPGFSSEQILTKPGQPVPEVSEVPEMTTPLPVTETTAPVTTIPTRVPDPFPGALKIKDNFPFGSGEFASEGTIYRVWLNDTYQWHNDMGE